MKRISSLVLVVALLFSVLSCAPAPSDEEVTKATVTVFAVLGMTVMATAFGMAVDDVEVDADMEAGKAKLVFDRFDVPAFFEEMGQGSDAADVEIDFNFSTMTGSIEMDGNNGLAADLELEGEVIETLVIEAQGDVITKLLANGKDYSHIRDVFETME
jgi:hypothetical protein